MASAAAAACRVQNWRRFLPYGGVSQVDSFYVINLFLILVQLSGMPLIINVRPDLKLPERVEGLFGTWNHSSKVTSAEVVESQQTLRTQTRENTRLPRTQVGLTKAEQLYPNVKKYQICERRD